MTSQMSSLSDWAEVRLSVCVCGVCEAREGF